MNWQDPAAIAGYIAVGGSGFLALILRMRKVWVRDNRDTTYDTEQTEWVKGLQSEIRQLRADKDNMFAQRLQDVVALAETKALNDYLTKELERMRATMEAMEATMLSLKRRLQSIDKTISVTDQAPLGPN